MRTFIGKPSREYGIAILRVVVGGVFFMHGAQKAFVFGLSGVTAGFEGMGIPAPALTAAFTTGVELLGGLALVLGFLTRFTAPALAIVMLGALSFVHFSAGFFMPDGYELVLTLMSASVALALTGPGALAVDNALARKDGAEAGVAIETTEVRRRAA
jgi:putative oxidoreductase